MPPELTPELAAWVGRSRTVEEEVGLSAVRRIASMLDLDPGAFRHGDPLPPHWFTLFVAETARHSDLGPDGHPKPGVFLPPIPLPRRMGAGRRVRIADSLRVGDIATRTTEVAAIVPKQARTGPITVLTMRHTIRRGEDLVAVEEFDAIYREAVAPGERSAVAPSVPAPAEAAWREEKLLGPALVFRYSAVTWNAHRIHYDADYARGEEGYPAAVQNGGLTMQLLLDAATRRSSARLAGFSARLTRALYVGDTVVLAGSAVADGTAKAWAADGDGNLCGEVEMEFA
ncbi:MaoC family dehydratase N-terminal domain-containing protein [Craurococcus roseus]|uniref:MaoC family dehydratase N-terminal domain-containing protein n=1 Tax=Craurococcus roseus TaxID=77585 RepID=A0ABP3QAM4_9PROT